jgi:N-acetylmuramoyl-L-alanine amidase
VVRVRRPPTLDRRHPLRGLVVAVDPGHPPGGAMGPTGLREAEANLAVARRLARLLERADAKAVLTRTGDTALGLEERAQIAQAAGAHLFVSVHHNAFPDGVDPFAASGTSTFFFHPHAEALARALQAELLHELHLRDLGVGRTSLAVLRRLTWMPAALTESMYMMVPDQEAALRDPGVQDRIARAHLRALERFLRARIASRRGPP